MSIETPVSVSQQYVDQVLRETIDPVELGQLPPAERAEVAKVEIDDNIRIIPREDTSDNTVKETGGMLPGDAIVGPLPGFDEEVTGEGDTTKSSPPTDSGPNDTERPSSNTPNAKATSPRSYVIRTAGVAGAVPND